MNAKERTAAVHEILDDAKGHYIDDDKFDPMELLDLFNSAAPLGMQVYASAPLEGVDKREALLDDLLAWMDANPATFGGWFAFILNGLVDLLRNRWIRVIVGRTIDNLWTASRSRFKFI